LELARRARRRTTTALARISTGMGREDRALRESLAQISMHIVEQDASTASEDSGEDQILPSERKEGEPKRFRKAPRSFRACCAYGFDRTLGSRELSISPGDVIRVSEWRRSSDWWFGTIEKLGAVSSGTVAVSSRQGVQENPKGTGTVAVASLSSATAAAGGSFLGHSGWFPRTHVVYGTEALAAITGDGQIVWEEEEVIGRASTG